MGCCRSGVFPKKLEGLSEITYGFETAWTHPEPIMDWLLNYCKVNHLNLVWSYEEEQGWGGFVEYLNGVLRDDFWDIPESHAEWESRGKECVCSWHEENVFPDCNVIAKVAVEVGECDKCGATYDVASRDGRCGDCGDCGNCCEDNINESEGK